MNENWKFSDIPYTSPDVEALQTRYDALTRRARAAACPEDLLLLAKADATGKTGFPDYAPTESYLRASL